MPAHDLDGTRARAARRRPRRRLSTSTRSTRRATFDRRPRAHRRRRRVPTARAPPPKAWSCRRSTAGRFAVDADRPRGRPRPAAAAALARRAARSPPASAPAIALGMAGSRTEGRADLRSLDASRARPSTRGTRVARHARWTAARVRSARRPARRRSAAPRPRAPRAGARPIRGWPATSTPTSTSPDAAARCRRSTRSAISASRSATIAAGQVSDADIDGTPARRARSTPRLAPAFANVDPAVAAARPELAGAVSGRSTPRVATPIVTAPSLQTAKGRAQLTHHAIARRPSTRSIAPRFPRRSSAACSTCTSWTWTARWPTVKVAGPGGAHTRRPVRRWPIASRSPT